MSSTFRSSFPWQLGFWTFHCCVNALPCVCAALLILGLRNDPEAVAAMACAIMTFIILYATLVSIPGPLADENHLLARALRLGAKIRVMISGLTLLLGFHPGNLAFLPDLWCGGYGYLGACYLTIPHFSSADLAHQVVGGFSTYYVAGILTGLGLSFLLLLISFFCIIMIRSHDRGSFFAGG